MAQYIIYGKRTEPWYNSETHEHNEPDKGFAALDYKGIRVSKLKDAYFYDSREEAQEYLDTKAPRNGAVFEIRKAK